MRLQDLPRRHPAEAQRIVADFNGIDLATVVETWNSSTFAVMLDQALLLALEDESRWAIQKGLTREKTIPNYLDFISLDALQAVKPKAVSILR